MILEIFSVMNNWIGLGTVVIPEELSENDCYGSYL